MARIGSDTESFESFPFPKVEQSIQFQTLKVTDNGVKLAAKGGGGGENVKRNAKARKLRKKPTAVRRRTPPRLA